MTIYRIIHDKIIIHQTEIPKPEFIHMLKYHKGDYIAQKYGISITILVRLIHSLGIKKPYVRGDMRRLKEARKCEF